jgi:hypothetical protein
MKSKYPSRVIAIICGLLISTALVHPSQGQQVKEPTQQELQQKQIRDVQERQLALQTQMNLIRKTNDLAERQRLLDEHLKVMMAQVQAMTKISGSVVNAASREIMLEERTQLITSLMDQMISHYEMEATCNAKQ